MLLIARLVEISRMPAQWVTARLNIKSDRGATAVEYGLMLALIAAVIIVAVVFLGKKTSSTFECTGTSIENRSDNC
jgi:pilus assembly protein Flp/PilA